MEDETAPARVPKSSVLLTCALTRKAVAGLPWRYQDVTGKFHAIYGNADCLLWDNRLHSILILFQNETKQYKYI